MPRPVHLQVNPDPPASFCEIPKKTEDYAHQLPAPGILVLTSQFVGEKITNFSPPETPQSSRFHIIHKFRLRPDLVDCDAIFWIAEPIVGL